METEGPSKTARATAYARAYHHVVDRPRILTDPLATRLLGITEQELIAAGEPTEDQPGSGAHYRPRRLFFAARARFAEDRIAAAVAAGVRQVVVLGAGMDTFAYRNPYPQLRVFEVDHPATQAWKRERLAAAEIAIPDTMTFAPVDFETQALATELANAGFDRTAPAVFVWLGVVFYLTPQAVQETLDYVATQPEPSEVIFDYLQQAGTDEDFAQLQERARRLAAAGEPWFSFFTPASIADELRARGLTEIEDLSATELISSYLERSTEFGGETPRALQASRLLRAGHRS